MKLKNKILEILENNQGDYISGEEIASLLGVSRNSIWKTINYLKREGYDISSARDGYMIPTDADIFSSNRIAILSQNNIDVMMIDEATSSNDIAKSLAFQGAREGTLVVVKRQNSGRGRMGRSFISNEENGLYMSLVLRPEVPISQSVLITVIGAVAALEAIEMTSGIECSIKWVNDIYIGEKKVCGILSEASFNFEQSYTDYVIIGIGVNVTPPKNGFDEQIKNIATSIFERSSPSGYKSLLCSKIVDRFLHYYNNLEDKSFIDIYRRKSNLIGKSVNVYRGNDIFAGTVIDIDQDANLVLQTDSGLLSFNSGEARVRKNEFEQ